MFMKNFSVPTKIYYEEDSLKYLKDIKNKRVYIITDEIMYKLGIVNKVTEVLQENENICKNFTEVKPEPTMEIVTSALRKFLEFQGEVVIAVGGGSVIDASKAMIYFLTSITEGGEDLIGKKPLFIAIPTTSGTGSEVTSYAVITDEKNHKKIALKSERMYANIAILDAQFTKTVPAKVTADTGMDVLTHAIEAYVSNKSSDCTDALAFIAIEEVYENIVEVYKNGNDIYRRSKLHNASCMAGIAFENSSLGINHSLAHAVGGKFKIFHGKINAVLLPYTVEFNSGLFYESNFEDFDTARKYAKVAKLLNLPSTDFKEGVIMLIKGIRELNNKLGIPNTIKDLNISEEEFMEHIDELAETALNDICTSGNPQRVSKEDLKKILGKAFK